MSDLVDRGTALERVGGDLDLLRELVELFRSDYPRLLAEISEACNRGDARWLQRTAHALKGSVGIFGSRAVVEAAAQLEILGQSAQLAAAPALVDSIRALMEKVDPALETLFVLDS